MTGFDLCRQADAFSGPQDQKTFRSVRPAKVIMMITGFVQGLLALLVHYKII